MNTMMTNFEEYLNQPEIRQQLRNENYPPIIPTGFSTYTQLPRIAGMLGRRASTLMKI